MKFCIFFVTPLLLSSALATHSARAENSTTVVPPTVESVVADEETPASADDIFVITEETVRITEETAAISEETARVTAETDAIDQETEAPSEGAIATVAETDGVTEEAAAAKQEIGSTAENALATTEESIEPLENDLKATEESVAPAEKTVATVEGSTAPAEEAVPSSDETMKMSEVIALLRQQQQELADQRKLLDSQSLKIATLTRELDGLREKSPEESGDFVEKPETGTKPQPAVAPAQVATVDTAPDTPKTETETETKTKSEKAIATGDEVAQAQADDPSRAMLEDFKGAWRLPGTDAALSIGGFVKTAVVYNFDPLQIKDRFIVGSIPVGINETTGDEAQSSVTADQSRLNFDLRSPTDYGIMRAFIEGDFAGSGETFRLRHAFGQWNRMLAGKTWSTFMDPGASPEELDFEGLNGRINVRQAQIRVMPTFGSDYELQIGLEDPNPEVQNGSGVTRTPDLVLAGRFEAYRRLHMKLALIAREIRAQSNNGDVSKEFAWGSSLSGNVSTPGLDERDKLLFQLNFGNGIGRYVNDLSSIGNYDGVFEPDTGNLELFDIAAGYISWQHWWGVNELRSNFTFGLVDVDNPDFMPDDAYQNTLRFSSNLIWSPIPRIDVGGEYLWGRRENENGDSGDATQLQLAVKYRF